MTAPTERGFALIGLDGPKDAANIGGALRAAHCYGVAQVNIARCRAKRGIKHATNTPAAHRHTPVFTVGDVLSYLPWATEVVAVDLVHDAIPLPEFRHPERAIYVFGPEDGTLGARILDRAQHRVMIPTRDCMNLAACVNVLLYDRMLKGGRFDAAIESAAPEIQATFYRRKAA